MLSDIYKAHQHQQTERRLEQERKRKQAIKSAQEVSSGFVDALNSGVESAYENQKKINHLVKELQTQSGLFLKQASQWINTVEAFNASLKELGDLPNWASIIEKDMLAICRSLEYAYNGPSMDIISSPVAENPPLCEMPTSLANLVPSEAETKLSPQTEEAPSPPPAEQTL